MHSVYVITGPHDTVSSLLAPYNSELIIPHTVNIQSMIQDKKHYLRQQLESITNDESQAQPTTNPYYPPQYRNYQDYKEHVMHDVPFYLSNTQAGDAALWTYIRTQYGIQNTDILPNGKILRRFNPNSKWDTYTIKHVSSTQHVHDIFDTLTDIRTDILLPNYLWIDHYDPDYTIEQRIQYLSAYKDYSWSLVEYSN